MNIILGKYKLTPNDISQCNWDLSEMVVRNKKIEVQGEDNTYEGDNVIGYSMPLERCLRIIISKNLSDVNKNVEIKEYISAYVKEKQELKELLENVLKVK